MPLQASPQVEQAIGTMVIAPVFLLGFHQFSANKIALDLSSQCLVQEQPLPGNRVLEPVIFPVPFPYLMASQAPFLDLVLV